MQSPMIGGDTWMVSASGTTKGDFSVSDRWVFTQIGNMTTNCLLAKVNLDAGAAGMSSPPGLTSWMEIGTVFYQNRQLGYALLRQQVELAYIADLQWGTPLARPLTLSFYMRANFLAAGTYSEAIRNRVGTVTTRSFVFEYTIAADDAWQLVSVTVPGCTDDVWGDGALKNPYALELVLALTSDKSGAYVATPAQVNSWQTADLLTSQRQFWFLQDVPNQIYLSGVQLERGSRRSSYDPRPSTLR